MLEIQYDLDLLREAAARGRFIRQERRLAGEYQKERAEFQNLNRSCVEQLKSAIQQIAADLQRTPTWRDLRLNGMHSNVIAKRFGTYKIDEIMAICGLEPNNFRSGGRAQGFTREVLIELIRDAHVRLCRVPNKADCRPPLLPRPSIFITIFGSWLEALEAAGFGLIARERERVMALQRRGRISEPS